LKKYFLTIFIIFIFYPFEAFSECAKPTMPSDAEWQQWLSEIYDEAHIFGISKTTLDREFTNLKPLKKVILRDRCQPESTITFKEYVYYRLDKTRVYSGEVKIKEYKNELEIISKNFNIQPRFIVSIWGLESYYGSSQGKSKIIPGLATLTFDQRRSEFYKKQLFAALKMLDDNLVQSEKLLGSWAGAMGQVQFLPTTFLESAVDFDNDGKKDIWNNEIDVFASIANYLTSLDRAPWDSSLTWGIEVNLPENINEIYDSLKQTNPKGCYAVKSMSIEKTISEWSSLGFKNINGELLANNKIKESHNARLVMPDGLKGRAFLVFQNYKSILYYNCSHYYAITIGLLSDKFIND
tara:strand:+ start:192 stop:1247 length:1056 start_codon:yes stop_codon:yes gene_type:complete